MATFQDALTTDMTACFLKTDEFAETVSWRDVSAGATTSITTVYQEYLGAIDEKTQAVFIVPVATAALMDRGDELTRTNGEVWQVIDLSQRDGQAMNVRAILPQTTA